VAIQIWVATLNGPGQWSSHASGAGQTSTSTASPGTIISPAPDYVIAQNSPYSGWQLRVSAWGKAVTGTTTANATFALYYGGTAGNQLLLSAATQIGAVTTAQTVPWKYQAHIQCRSNGTSGTVMSYGSLDMASAAAPAPTSDTFRNLFPLSAPGTVTIDTTASGKTLVLSAWVSTATGSPSVTCDIFTLEALS
jgi:hypothetical protein